MTATLQAHREAGTKIAGGAASNDAETRPSILFVSRKWPPAVGGMETYSVKVSEELARVADVETLVLPGQSDGSAPKPASLLAFALRAAVRIVFRRNAPDVVHIADMASWPLALFAQIRSRRSKITLSAHGTDVAFPDRPGVVPRMYGLYMQLGGYLVGKRMVVVNSHATKAKTEALGYENTCVVPLATDMTSALDTRERSDTERRILFAGRLVERKGCRWFIENVLSELPEKVVLEVAGTVWDGAEKAALKHPRVRFLGSLDQNALRQAYADADLVIVPNIASASLSFEGFGLVAAEAAAAGGVVLASAHTGLEDAVIDGETGFKLPAGDALAWLTKVREVLSWDEPKRAEFAVRASDRASEHYTWERVARSTYDAYGLTE